MALLQSGNLGFEFCYAHTDGEWIYYQLRFLWCNESVVNDSVLKREGAYWGQRPPGRFLACEHAHDGLLPLLKKVLATDTADYWEPVDPDVIIAVYPKDYFPFLPSHWKRVFRNEEEKRAEEVRQKLEEERGQQPSDVFTLIAFVDAFNFKDAAYYSSGGLSLQMAVKRQELQRFLSDLKREYEAFRLANKMEDSKW